MYDVESDEERDQLDSVAARLRAGRCALAMTLYAIAHRRRTPEQVHDVLDRARRVVHHNRLVRRRWANRFSVH